MVKFEEHLFLALVIKVVNLNPLLDSLIFGL